MVALSLSSIVIYVLLLAAIGVRKQLIVWMRAISLGLQLLRYAIPRKSSVFIIWAPNIG